MFPPVLRSAFTDVPVLSCAGPVALACSVSAVDIPGLLAVITMSVVVGVPILLMSSLLYCF